MLICHRSIKNVKFLLHLLLLLTTLGTQRSVYLHNMVNNRLVFTTLTPTVFRYGFTFYGQTPTFQ